MVEPNRSPMSDVAIVAVFAGVIAAFTLVPAIPVGTSGVPITLQTLAIALAGLLLGPWRGMAAVLLYLLVGFAGLPVFAQGSAGLGVLVRPSAGYLLAFPLAALVTGWLARIVVARVTSPPARTVGFAVAALVGSLGLIHPLGVVGLHVNAQLSWGQAIAADVIYLPGDLLKAAFAAVIAVAVHRALPTLLARPQVPPASVAASHP
ncbi:MAG: biotin transporter BioY [Propioniciclava sp.]